MTPRRLAIRRAAQRDMARRAAFVAAERGAHVAAAQIDALMVWLERLADSGAQFGPEIAARPGLRVIGWRRQASVLARFTADEMQIVRIYFRGEDWRR